MRAPTVLIALLLLSSCVSVATNTESRVTGLTRAFIDTVNRADLEDFLAFFWEDADGFMRAPRNAARLEGLDEIRRGVTPAFSQLPPAPLVVHELRYRQSGDLAVVSFEAGTSTEHLRRTIVWLRRGAEWKIIHIHASNLTPSG